MAKAGNIAEKDFVETIAVSWNVIEHDTSMKKIKLCEVITTLELGGAQRSTLDIVRALDKRRYDITLVTSSSGELLSDAFSLEGVNVVLLASLKRNINLFFDAKAFFDLYVFFKQAKPDIVHTHSSKAGILGRWAARLAGVKRIIHTVHGWGFHRYQNRLQRAIVIYLERLTAELSDYLIVVSQYDMAYGLSNGIGRKDRYQLIRCGIDRKMFQVHYNGLFRKQYDIDDDCFVVGMIACFKPQKAPLDFIYAARRVVREVTQVKFVMVGDGHLRPKIEKTIERLGMSDKFLLLGWRRDSALLLSSFDVVALTSLWEGLPIVFLEAMASAKPVVATNINGNTEVIKDGVNGYLVEPKNHQLFADRIISLYRDPLLRRHMGERGQASIDAQCEAMHMASRIDALYRQCCAGEMGV